VAEARSSPARRVHLFLVARRREYWWGELLAEGDRGEEETTGRGLGWREGRETRGAAYARREQSVRARASNADASRRKGERRRRECESGERKREGEREGESQ